MIVKGAKKPDVFTKKAPKPFASIFNKTLRDKRLSYRARGILSYLLSKPDNWRVLFEDVLNNGTEGRDAVRACFRELKEFGYAKLEKGAGTGAVGSRWIICEDPGTEMPFSSLSGDGVFPDVRENGVLKNKREEGTRKKDRNATQSSREAGGLDFVVNKPDFALRIRAIFHRRETTGFSDKEAKAYKKIEKKITDDDLLMVERCYKRQWPPNREKNILRHDLFTFLGNYETEVDRARQWCEKHPLPGAKKVKAAPVPEPVIDLPPLDPAGSKDFCLKFERQYGRLPAGYKHDGDEIVFVGRNGASK